MAGVDCKQPEPADEHSRPAVFDKKRLFFKRNAACITNRDKGVPGDDDRLNPRFDFTTRTSDFGRGHPLFTAGFRRYTKRLNHNAFAAVGRIVRRRQVVASIEYVDVRKGMVLVAEDGQLMQCLDRDLNTPGNWRAILQLKLKNLKTGSIAMQRVRPQDKVEVAYLEKRDFQYLYQEGNDYIFMDTETFDQAPLPKDLLGDQMKYFARTTSLS